MASPENESSPRTRRTFGDTKEAAEFVGMLERFERGEIGPDEYRQYRLSRGVYGQRQEALHMVRVKIPQGVLTSPQLRVLADVAERFSRGYGHVTTRQNLQFHAVKPASLGPLLERIAESGLTTREACSHTVRNVTGCPYAGVCGGAPFDVTPYAELVTRHFLRGALGSGLPRKFKIAVSGCPDDCANGAINDIGLIAVLRDGRRGFRVLAGGGTATLPVSGGVLLDFVPAEELLAACEAIVRVFNEEGERKQIAKARMKWAIRRLGWERYQALFRKHFDAILAEGGRPLPLEASALAGEAPPPRPLAPPTAGRLPEPFAAWRERSVRAQAQPGYVTALVWLPIGDISAAQLRGLADLVEALGDGTVRTTQSQNLVARWVPESHLGDFWLRLQGLGLGEPHAESLSDVVSCPGAETCRIAVTASRGVAQLLGEHLRQVGNRALGADIKVSGCPNGCAQHHIATIGLQGGVRRLGGDLVPLYHLTLGGRVDEAGAAFGRLVGKIPARRVPAAVDRLLEHHRTHAEPGEGLKAFIQRLEVASARALLADLTELDAGQTQPEDFVDLGSSVKFEVVAMDGECAQ